MFLNSVSKQLRIQYFSGYNTEFYMEFCQLTIIRKKNNVVTSDECSFCKEDSETILHGFFICEKVMPLFNSLSMLIYRYTARRSGFNVCNTILGETPLSSENRIVKFCITIYKTIHI